MQLEGETHSRVSLSTICCSQRFLAYVMRDCVIFTSSSFFVCCREDSFYFQLILFQNVTDTTIKTISLFEHLSSWKSLLFMLFSFLLSNDSCSSHSVHNTIILLLVELINSNIFLHNSLDE